MTREDEYETPVDFGDAAAQHSSSGMATMSIDTPTSAPVFSGDNNNAAIQSEPRLTAKESSSLKFNNNNSADGNSFHSSPQFRYNNSRNSTPQRTKIPRDLEQKLRYRHNCRDRLESRNIHRTNHGIANNNATANNNTTTDDNNNQLPTTTAAAAAAPLPKALTDLLLQTAILGIDTTAKLSKPTLALTKNTLLPQIILPLLTELWETYAPDRLQTWMKVVPSSLSNLYDLLWDTDAGRQLGNSSLQLGEDVLDMMSSEVARQLWIDVTVALIKGLDALHTPEVRALLDQYAVSMCRLVDVMGSGKAKQVWFDLSDTIWAALEVGNDDVMVMALAEGCAKVCFALERERDGLRRRRQGGVSNGGSEVGKNGKVKTEALIAAARRRKERDQRQMEAYPPGKEVLRGEGGRSDIEDALLNGLGCLAKNDEQPLENDDADQIYMNMGSVQDDGDNERPPEKVIVPASSMEESPRSNDVDVVVRDDDESEITTEIEDLRRNDSDLPKQSTQVRDTRQEQQHGGALFYEEEQNDNIEPAVVDDDVNHGEDETSEQYDNFDESVLQFYRRLNDVLTQTRKEAKLREAIEAREDESPEESKCVNSGENHQARQLIKEESNKSQPAVPSYYGIGQFMISKKWWKLLLVAWICGTLTMCLLWAALGCYGFYIIFIAEAHIPVSPPAQAMQPPIVIQITTATSEGLNNSECNFVETEQADNGDVASISLDQWKELQRDVDAAIDQAKQSL